MLCDTSYNCGHISLYCPKIKEIEDKIKIKIKLNKIDKNKIKSE